MSFVFKGRLHRLAVNSLECLFAFSSGITGARAAFPTPADGDFAEGKGRLAIRGGWRFLHLEGNPREMGLQQGKLLGPVIRRLLDEYLRGLLLWRGLTRAELLRRGLRMEPFIPERYIEEMRAIAEGADMDYQDALIAHTFLESIQVARCSCYAAYGASTRNGEMIFGRNLDFLSMGFAHRAELIVFCKPENGAPFISVSWPGWCGTLTAVNLNGLCLGLLNVARFTRDATGLPYVILFRRMAQEAATCDEAIALLRSAARTYSNSVLLAQTSPVPRAVVVEYTRDEVAVREGRPGDDFVVATNHFRKLGRKAEWPDDRGYSRYPALVGLLRKRRGDLDLGTDIFPDPRVHLSNSLHALVAAPERRTFRVALGRRPAAAGPYRSFRYDENGIALPPLERAAPQFCMAQPNSL